MFITVATRPGMQQRAIDFVPFTTALWPCDLQAGLRPADVYLASVSPPDEHGYCSFGFMLWASLDLVEAATVVIAEVDEDHIVTYGDNYVHVSQLDYLVEKHAPTTYGDVAATMGFTAPSAIERQIAAHAATLLRDGDTFQLGAGTVSMAVVSISRAKMIWAFIPRSVPLVLPSSLPLAISMGLVRPSIRTRRCVLPSGAMRLLSILPIAIPPSSCAACATNNPRIIAQHDNMVAINTALSIDLTGQVAAESFGPQMYSGVGGQLDFTIGAMLAQHGRAVTLLPSTARQGSVVGSCHCTRRAR